MTSTEQRLNKSLIRILSDDEDIDKPTMFIEKKSYSKRDLIKALETNDPIQDKLLDILILSLDTENNFGRSK